MSIRFADAAKARQLRAFFAQHGRVYIVVDATSPEVQVPPHLRGDPALRLVLNQRMPQPIHIRDDALQSDFSFGGQPYPCLIPMRAIWAVYPPEAGIEQGIVWEQDIPDALRTTGEQAQPQSQADEETAETPSAPTAKKTVRHLRVVK